MTILLNFNFYVQINFNKSKSKSKSKGKNTMNKILVQFEKDYEQEIEFEKPVTDIKILDSSLKGRLLARRGIICLILGMLIIYISSRKTVSYDPSSHVVISQEAYYDLARQNIHWDSEKRTWINNSTKE